MWSDGSVVVDCEPDPTAAWATFDPTQLTPQQLADRQARQQIRNRLAALDAGTLTPAQHQQSTAWIARKLLALMNEAD